MCLVAIAWNPVLDPKGGTFQLVVAANRDEFHARPSVALAPWPDEPNIVGGRDLEKGGSWFALRDDGRFALVTNYRDFRREKRLDAPSRGEIVASGVRSAASPCEWASELARASKAYEPFNVIVGDRRELAWHTNVTGEVRKLEPGLYGLSNALLDEPWPKVEALRAEMRAALASPEVARASSEISVPNPFEERLLRALASEKRAATERLPDTGVGPEMEAALSPAFIRFGTYGTRCSSILTIDAHRHARFVERTFDAAGHPHDTTVIAVGLL